MTLAEADTIVAPATAPGRAALSVWRVSGPEAVALAERVFRARSGRPLREVAERQLVLGWLIQPGSGEPLDEGFAAVMRRPRSYTGEDMVEFFCHGGTAVYQAVLRALLAAGGRLATPGEFTRRAFLAGRLDLTQAQAVAALSEARDEAGRRFALRQLEGGVRRRLESIWRRLEDLRIDLEAQLDFPDDDTESPRLDRIGEIVASLADEMAGLEEAARRGDRLRSGIRLVLVGRPNAGKSSLFNALLGRERAITSAVAGTTRDTVEASLEIAGREVVLVDTAGVAGGPVDNAGRGAPQAGPAERDGAPAAPEARTLEAIAQRRTWQAVAEAAGALLVVDGAAGVCETDAELARRLAGKPFEVVVNKIDRMKRGERLAQLFGREPVHVSAREGAGLAELSERIRRTWLSGERAGEGPEGAGEASEEVWLSQAWQVAALVQGREALLRAAGPARAGTLDLVAADLAAAQRAVGEILGRGGTPDAFLDRIFERFCIGK